LIFYANPSKYKFVCSVSVTGNFLVVSFENVGLKFLLYFDITLSFIIQEIFRLVIVLVDPFLKENILKRV